MISPQRLIKAKKDEHFGKFLEMIKSLCMKIPLLDALQQMPKFTKFMKDILAHWRKVEDIETIALMEECSALIQNGHPPKLKDPGSFSIPCTISKTKISKAFCNLSASVSLMPISTWKKLGLGDLKLTTMTLQLADHSCRYPLGIFEDVPMKVGDFVVPTDFVVLEMNEDPRIPIILERPFLTTARAVIDVNNICSLWR